jgi:hypothetical protein
MRSFCCSAVESDIELGDPGVVIDLERVPTDIDTPDFDLDGPDLDLGEPDLDIDDPVIDLDGPDFGVVLVCLERDRRNPSDSASLVSD